MKNLNSSLNTGKTFFLLALTLVGALTVGSQQNAKADALGEVGGDPQMAVEMIPMAPWGLPDDPLEKCMDDAQKKFRKCTKKNGIAGVTKCYAQRQKDFDACYDKFF